MTGAISEVLAVPSTRLPGPSIIEDKIRARMVRWRVEAGFTQQDVISSLDWSVSRIHRVETGPQHPTTSDLMAMMAIYGVSDTERQQILSMVQANKGRWRELSGVNAQVQADLRYAEYESYADTIRSYHPSTVPDFLCQSFEGHKDDPNEGIDATGYIPPTVRSKRPNLLLSTQGPEMIIILDESVLYRTFARAAVQQDNGCAWVEKVQAAIQSANTRGLALRGLPLDRGRNPSVSIQVAPFELGAHALLAYGTTTLLDFCDPEVAPRLYEDSRSADGTVRSVQGMEQKFRSDFEHVAAMAPAPDRTTDAIVEISAAVARRRNSYLDHF